MACVWRSLLVVSGGRGWGWRNHKLFLSPMLGGGGVEKISGETEGVGGRKNFGDSNEKVDDLPTTPIPPTHIHTHTHTFSPSPQTDNK